MTINKNDKQKVDLEVTLSKPSNSGTLPSQEDIESLQANAGRLNKVISAVVNKQSDMNELATKLSMYVGKDIAKLPPESMAAVSQIINTMLVKNQMLKELLQKGSTKTIDNEVRNKGPK